MRKAKELPPAIRAVADEARRQQTRVAYLARAGEWVTCEAGHDVCRIARDIPNTEPHALLENFTDWQQMVVPETLVPPPKCECGASWMDGGRSPYGPNRLHFGGGWR